jgi:2-keto-3-deoxy-L-rhamnonate aldolase RhmA
MAEKQSADEIFTGIRRFRAMLKAGETIIATSVTFNDPLVTDALADSVDLLWYDLEHTQQDPATLNAHLAIARGRGKGTVVRVGSVHPSVIKPVLDAGADGIVAAQIRTVAEVEELITNCKYPPMGTRGVAPRVPSNYDRIGLDYFSVANENIFTSVMIETAEALEAIDKIVQVPNLDSVVIGPFDLSGALGDLGNLESPVIQEGCDRIVAAAHSAGIYVGCGMGGSAQFARSMAARGVDWLQVGSDYSHLLQRMDELVAEIKA